MAKSSDSGKAWLAAAIIFLLGIALSLFYFKPSISGAVIGEQGEEKTQELGLKAESSITEEITLSDFGENNLLAAFKLSGNLQTSDEDADVKVYLRANGNEYLVLDFDAIKESAINEITGFAVKEGGGDRGGGGNAGGDNRGGNGGGDGGGGDKGGGNEGNGNGGSDGGNNEGGGEEAGQQENNAPEQNNANNENQANNQEQENNEEQVNGEQELENQNINQEEPTPEENQGQAEQEAEQTPEAAGAGAEAGAEEQPQEEAEAQEQEQNAGGENQNAEEQQPATEEQQAQEQAENEITGGAAFGAQAAEKKEENKKQTYVFHGLCSDTCDLSDENLDSQNYELVFEISGDVELKISDATYIIIEKEEEQNEEPQNNEANETAGNETITLPQNQTAENGTVNEIIAAPVLSTAPTSSFGGTSPTGTTTETSTTTIAAPIEATALLTTETLLPAASLPAAPETVASSPLSQEVLFRAIGANVHAISIITVPQISIREINFALEKEANDVRLDVQALPARPAELPAAGAESAALAITGAAVASPVSAYQYLQITVSGGATSDDVALAKMKFSVDKPWLAESNYNKNSVRLNRWHNERWNELPTTFISEAPDSYTYEAESPGFSVFAVTAERPAAQQQAGTMRGEIKSGGTTALITTSISGATAAMQIPQPTKGSSSILVLLIALAAGAILFAKRRAAQKHRRKK